MFQTLASTFSKHLHLFISQTILFYLINHEIISGAKKIIILVQTRGFKQVFVWVCGSVQAAPGTLPHNTWIMSSYNEPLQLLNSFHFFFHSQNGPSSASGWGKMRLFVAQKMFYRFKKKISLITYIMHQNQRAFPCRTFKFPSQF